MFVIKIEFLVFDCKWKVFMFEKNIEFFWIYDINCKEGGYLIRYF